MIPTQDILLPQDAASLVISEAWSHPESTLVNIYLSQGYFMPPFRLCPAINNLVQMHHAAIKRVRHLYKNFKSLLLCREL